MHWLKKMKIQLSGIHDHGSAGPERLSELVEEMGEIDMSKLPIGDKTLSAKRNYR